MNEHNANTVNAAKIERQVNHLYRLRAAPDKTLPMGWADGMVPPPAANAMVKAGLAKIDEHPPKEKYGPVTRTVTAL